MYTCGLKEARGPQFADPCLTYSSSTKKVIEYILRITYDTNICLILKETKNTK